uniref:UDP-glucose 4-epimerase n=1 Tax=Phallusia mammillata TaxID=59560 RepID=A0A6F9DE01_9ASCI|nr:probable UDP-glucose 4-epimerase [Phallusia mammillata]
MNGFLKTKAVLVTGGAGFIGSHTVVELLQENETVVVIDNLSNAASDANNLPPAISRIKSIVTSSQAKNLHFIKGGYGDKSMLDKVFKKYNIQAVIHFGGFKAVGESKQLPLMYYRNNVAETLNLIKAMNEHNVKNMIFSSSATVYSEGPPEDLPLVEESPLGNCTCPYASTKLFIENILRDVTMSDDGWKVMALRYFNPVGAHKSGKIGEDPKGIPNNLMPYIAQVAVGRRKHLNVFGNDYPTIDGTGVRDYVHVVDVAKGHTAALHALDAMKSGFRAYNLGSGRGTSVLEMVQIFSEVSGVEIKTQIKERRPGDVAIFYCDPARAWNELGWKTEKTVHDMCADLWTFQQNNPNGYVSAEYNGKT